VEYTQPSALALASMARAGSKEAGPSTAMHLDWICDMCKAQNFVRCGSCHYA
jgi:hypothetical protein